MLDAREYASSFSENLERAGCARALDLEFVKRRDSCIGVGQQLCTGRAEGGILVYFTGGDERVDTHLEVIELLNGITKLSLVNFEASFVEFSEKARTIFVGLLAADGDRFGLRF